MSSHEASVQVIDFARTFVRFSTTRVNHTPRLLVAGAATLLADPSQGRPEDLTCYMSRPCIAEAMYVERGLIHDPVSEFRIFAAPRDQFMICKTHADARHDVISVHRFGEVMPTYDGRGAKVVQLEVAVAPSKALPVTNYAEFRTHLMANRPFVCRTEYALAGTSQRWRLEYPADTINVAHGNEGWQIDAGPIAMPLSEPTELPVAQLRPAYLVFNQFDYAEYVIKTPCPVGGGQTQHYGQHTPLTCKHQIFALA